MLTVRELTAADDFAAVGDVYAESWKKAYRGIVPDGYLDRLTHDRWSAFLSANPSSSLGMFLHGRLIGTAYACFARDPLRDGYGEIVGLYVRPAYTGYGYGRRLMTSALEKLSRDGCADVCLWTLTQNARAAGFYEHMGFAKSGRTQTETIGGAELVLLEYVTRLH